MEKQRIPSRQYIFTGIGSILAIIGGLAWINTPLPSHTDKQQIFFQTASTPSKSVVEISKTNTSPRSESITDLAQKEREKNLQPGAKTICLDGEVCLNNSECGDEGLCLINDSYCSGQDKDCTTHTQPSECEKQAACSRYTVRSCQCARGDKEELIP